MFLSWRLRLNIFTDPFEKSPIHQKEMPLPQKITPDNIRESVVEVKYLSDLPFELLLGMFFNVLKDAFKYTNRPLQSAAAVQSNLGNPGQELKIRIGNANLFYNDHITIQPSPNTFVFTCKEKYLGWALYKSEIIKALELLDSGSYFKSWTRVGIRYISEYPSKDLYEIIKFKFGFGIPEVKSVTTTLRSEFDFKDSRVILNLSNRVPVIRQNTDTKQIETIQISIIDVDVISDNLRITSLKDLLKDIETNHEKEKEVYFRMLTDDFLKSLNPEY